MLIGPRKSNLDSYLLDWDTETVSKWTTGYEKLRKLVRFFNSSTTSRAKEIVVVFLLDRMAADKTQKIEGLNVEFIEPRQRNGLSFFLLLPFSFFCKFNFVIFSTLFPGYIYKTAKD